LTKTFEFATWPCTDKYVDNPKMLQPAFRGLLWPERVKGLNSISNGVDKERLNGHGFLCWDSVQDHLDYIADKERQASVGMHFAETLRGDPGGLVIVHAVLSVETTLQIVHAPLTEVALITFSDRAELEKFKPVVDKYVAYANRKETLPIAAAFGQTIDMKDVEETKIMLITGWKTAEDQKMFRRSDEVAEILKDMDQVGFDTKSRTISFDAILEEEAS